MHHGVPRKFRGRQQRALDVNVSIHQTRHQQMTAARFASRMIRRIRPALTSIVPGNSARLSTSTMIPEIRCTLIACREWRAPATGGKEGTRRNTGLLTREAGLENNGEARSSQWTASAFTGQETRVTSAHSREKAKPLANFAKAANLESLCISTTSSTGLSAPLPRADEDETTMKRKLPSRRTAPPSPCSCRRSSSSSAKFSSGAR